MAKATRKKIPDDLAKEFEDKAAALDDRAKVLLNWVIGVVLIGIVLVLVLPPLIALIDREISGVDTPKVVDQLRDSVKNLTRDLNVIDKKRKSLIGRVKKEINAPYAVWKRDLPVTKQEIPGTLNALQPLSGGGFLAVGSEAGNLLLLRINTDGRQWTPVRPADKVNKRITGALNALQPLPSGGFLAVGLEGDPFRPRILLFRINTDGRQQPLIRPTGKDNKRIPGMLKALQPLPRGGFLAVGSEGNYLSRRILLFRINADGRQWTPIRPTGKDNKRIPGTLNALRPLPGGGFLAVGSEGGNLFLLRINTDGRQWTPIRPVDKVNKRIPGALYALQPLRSGGFLAVGLEGTPFTPRILLFRINPDRRQWTPIRPTGKDNKRIPGTLNALQPLPSGGFLAVGSEGGLLSRRILLFRINADGRQWTPIRPADKDNKRVPGTMNALQLLPGGGFLAVGSEGSFSKTLPGGFPTKGSKWYLPIPLFGEGLVALGSPKSLAEFRLVVIRSTHFGGSFPTASSAKKPNAVAASFELLIKVLTIDTLLLPQSVRSVRAEASDLLKRWKTLFPTLTTTQINLDAVEKLWGESRPLRRLGQIASRIAVIALLIYLVQILVNLYRYNKRLAAFYQARRDAIRLAQAAGTPFSEQVALPFNELVASLSPDNLDFGKTPAPPTQQSFEIFRDAAKTAAKPKG